jgi:hypothetical protein
VPLDLYCFACKKILINGTKKRAVCIKKKFAHFSTKEKSGLLRYKIGDVKEDKFSELKRKIMQLFA